MRKFLGTIGYIVVIAALAIVGVFGIVALPEAKEGVDILKSQIGLLPLIAIVGGFGSAIGVAFFAIANFFRIKAKTKKAE
ncbi:MAG: hypothetical protein ACRC42_04745 [Mycoplasma sp.]